MQEYNMDGGDDNDFNLFSPLNLTPELETKKKKHLSGGDNRLTKKPRLQLSPENSPSHRERDFPEFESNKLLELQDEIERLKVEQYRSIFSPYCFPVLIFFSELEKSILEERIRELNELHIADTTEAMEKAECLAKVIEGTSFSRISRFLF